MPRSRFLALLIPAVCACEPPPAAAPPPPAGRSPAPSSTASAPAPATSAPAAAAPPWKWREGETVRVIGDVPRPYVGLGSVRWLSERTLAIEAHNMVAYTVEPAPVILWDIATRTARAYLPKGGTGLSADPKGRWVAAGRTVYRLDEPGTPTFALPSDDTWSSWDGERVLSAKLGHIEVWPREGGKPVSTHEVDFVNELFLLGDGRIPVYLGANDGLAILDPASGKQAKGFAGRKIGNFFSPDGKRLFAQETGGKDLLELDPATAAAVRTVPLPNPSGNPLTFSSDGSRAAFSDAGGCVVVSTQDGAVLGKVPRPDGAAWLGCRLSPDGSRVAGRVQPDGKDRGSEELHVSTFGEKPEMQRTSIKTVEKIERAALAPDGSALAVTYRIYPGSGSTVSVSLWSLAPVRVTKDGLSGRVAVGAGAVAAHAAPDGALRAIDVRTGEVTAELPKLPAEPRALAVLAGHVVAGLPDGRIAFVSLATKALRYGSRSLQFHTGAAEILDIEPSPDGKQALVLARGAGDEYDQNKGHGVIAMVDVETGKVGVQTVLGEPAYFATFDAPGKRVAVVSSHIATVFEVGYPLVEKIRHKDYMFPGKLRFSDDGSFLVTTALVGWSGRIDLGSGAAKRRPDTDPKATSRALGDKVALFDEHRVFLHRASGDEPLTLRSIRVGQTRHGVAYLPRGGFEASADALPHVPVCVGDPPSEQRCGFAPEMGAPVTAGLAAGWLAGK